MQSGTDLAEFNSGVSELLSEIAPDDKSPRLTPELLASVEEIAKVSNSTHCSKRSHRFARFISTSRAR